MTNWEETANYVLYQVGSLVKARDGITGKIVSTGATIDIPFNFVAPLLLNSGTIFIKPKPSGIYSVAADMVIPNATNGGIRVIGGGYKWYGNGVVLKGTATCTTAILHDLDNAISMNTFIGLGFHGDQATNTLNLDGIRSVGQDTKFIDCSMYDCKGGIRCKAHSHIERCYLEKVSNEGIYLDGDNAFITNNIFWDNGTDIMMIGTSDLTQIAHNRTANSDEFIRTYASAASVDDVRVSSNIAVDLNDQFIHIDLGDIDGWTIDHNLVDGDSNTTYFFNIDGGSSITNSKCHDNIVQDLTSTFLNGTTTGLDVYRNIGYVSENWGTSGNVADGGTIAHGITGTPTYADAKATVTGDIVTISALDAANITVAIKDEGGGAGTAQPLYWMARE